MIEYTIEASVDDVKWTLYSHVDTNNNGIAKNFICESTLEECEARLNQMKALSETDGKTCLNCFHAIERPEWVGLTKEEMREAWYKFDFEDHYEMCEWIDARLKEKNT